MGEYWKERMDEWMNAFNHSIIQSFRRNILTHRTDLDYDKVR